MQQLTDQGSEFHLGNLGSEVLVLLWVLQEVDKLQDLHLGFFTPGHIFKLHINFVLHHFCRWLTQAKGSTPSTANASSHWSSPQCEQQEDDKKQGGYHAEEKGAENPRISSWSNIFSPHIWIVPAKPTHHSRCCRPQQDDMTAPGQAQHGPSPGFSQMCRHCQCWTRHNSAGWSNIEWKVTLKDRRVWTTVVSFSAGCAQLRPGFIQLTLLCLLDLILSSHHITVGARL